MKHQLSTGYGAAAETAVAMEQQGRYNDAADYWRMARHAAHSTANQEWALRREEFCLIFGRRLQRAAKQAA